MKEIGGYFEFEHLEGAEYHLPPAVALNCARNAIALAVQLRGCGRVWLPHLLCDSVRGALERRGIDCAHYHISPDFLPAQGAAFEEGDAIVLVNYYGQLSPEWITKLAGRFPNVILDNTQAFFCPPPPGIDTVYSCRKYFGVPDGAYLYAPTQPGFAALPPERVADRCHHLLGRLEDSASPYLKEFRENDTRFAESGPAGMSLFTHNILRAVDYALVRRRRNENYRFLEDALRSRNGIAPAFADGPFAYPFYAENGPEIRRKLAANGVYVPTLWPNALPHPAHWIERKYAENILPLPCDQRYTTDDMRTVLEVLRTCI